MAIKNNTTLLQNILSQVNNLPSVSEGVELPELVNPAAAADIGLNKEAIDAEGNKITGTFTLDEEVDTNTELIAQIASALEGKAACGGGEMTVEELADNVGLGNYSSQSFIFIKGMTFLDLINSKLNAQGYTANIFYANGTNVLATPVSGGSGMFPSPIQLNGVTVSVNDIIQEAYYYIA